MLDGFHKGLSLVQALIIPPLEFLVCEKAAEISLS
jgi:hypothetical protein